MSAFGRGCVKTQNQGPEIVSRLGEYLVEVSCLLTGRYRLVGQSAASHVAFECDFRGEPVGEFSHSLGHKRSPISRSVVVVACYFLTTGVFKSGRLQLLYAQLIS